MRPVRPATLGSLTLNDRHHLRMVFPWFDRDLYWNKWTKHEITIHRHPDNDAAARRMWGQCDDHRSARQRAEGHHRFGLQHDGRRWPVVRHAHAVIGAGQGHAARSDRRARQSMAAAWAE